MRSMTGDDLVAGLDRADGDRAGSHHIAVDMHRARAALRDAAPVFRSGEADVFPNDPQQRRIGLHLHVADLAVDVELSHAPPRKGTTVCLAAFLAGGRKARLAFRRQRKAYSNWLRPSR